jgi:hypothetical protein
MSFTDDSLYILAVLLASAALAEWLSRKPGFRLVGGALIVIVLVAILANLGVVPTFSATAPPLYGQLLSVGAPVAIFLLLLDVHLAALKKAGGPMLLAFGLGAAGTMVGVMTSARITGVGEWLGELAAPFTGMFVATYTGGSANFNALALHYDVMREGVLYAGANAVDNTVTAFWMAGAAPRVRSGGGGGGRGRFRFESDRPDEPGRAACHGIRRSLDLGRRRGMAGIAGHAHPLDPDPDHAGAAGRPVAARAAPVRRPGARHLWKLPVPRCDRRVL